MVVPPNGGAETRVGERDIVNGGIVCVRVGGFLGNLVNHFILQETDMAGGPPKMNFRDMAAKGIKSTPSRNIEGAAPLMAKNST